MNPSIIKGDKSYTVFNVEGKSTVKSRDMLSCESWRSGQRPLSSIGVVLKFLPSIMKSTEFINVN